MCVASSESQWKPSASIELLKNKSAIINKVRNFFTELNYIEVETPIIARFGVTDPYLNNLTTQINNKTYYLQTSPEHHMKRLLAAGSGPIFQIAKVFRDDEFGRWHNPEFTMLEWYKLEIDHFALMNEVDQFLQHLVNGPPLIYKTYQQAFRDACDFDPFATNITELKKILKTFKLNNILNENESDLDQYLFLLMSHVVEPSLGMQPIAIYNFPQSQAALAKINNKVAERFEIYYHGVEIANGFHELNDAVVLAQRFDSNLAFRKQRGLALLEPDQYLLDAQKSGLPVCSGVALGLDRLIALILQKDSIQETLTFNFEIA